MVVRFVCVPICASACPVCPVCVPAPPGVFLPVLWVWTGAVWVWSGARESVGGLVLRGFGLCGSCVCPVCVPAPPGVFLPVARVRWWVGMVVRVGCPCVPCLSRVRVCPGSPRCLFTGTVTIEQFEAGHPKNPYCSAVGDSKFLLSGPVDRGDLEATRHTCAASCSSRSE